MRRHRDIRPSPTTRPRHPPGPSAVPRERQDGSAQWEEAPGTPDDDVQTSAPPSSSTHDPPTMPCVATSSFTIRTRDASIAACCICSDPFEVGSGLRRKSASREHCGTARTHAVPKSFAVARSEAVDASSGTPWAGVTGRDRRRIRRRDHHIFATDAHRRRIAKRHGVPIEVTELRGRALDGSS